MAIQPATCIFCLTRPVSRRGEHVWDDWLNWKDGVRIRDKYEFVENGPDGQPVRTYPKASVDLAYPIVCQKCNNEWMSDITNESKKTLEVIIRHGRHFILMERGIASLVALAFLKAVVVDYGGTRRKKPFFLPSVRQRFMQTLAIPNGVVIWMASFDKARRGHAWGNYLTLESGLYSGYEIYICTYLVGHLLIQVAIPRWAKRSRRRPPLPPLGNANKLWSDAAIQVWPDVNRANWPPEAHFSSDSVECFADRIHSLRINASTGELVIPLPPRCH